MFSPRKATLQELIELHDKGKLVGVFDISADTYHRAPGISKSGLDDVYDSPATFRFNRENPEEPTDEMDFGNATHSALLEPTQFRERYALAPPELVRKGTKDWNAFVEDHPGYTVLKAGGETGHEKIAAMVKVMREHKRASLLKGLVELSFFWTDPDTGLLCKCRTDVITEKGIITDYKTAVAVYPARLWAAAMFRQRYHVQGAFYLDGVASACAQAGVKLPVPMPEAFVFFAQKKKPPYLAKPWLLGNASALLGQRTYREELKLVAACEKTKIWPAYPEQIEPCECPEYAWSQELEGSDDDGDEGEDL